MHDLPTATLAAIVIVAVLGLIDIAGARRLLQWRRSEFILAMVAFAGVAVLGVLWGVGIAIALSLLNFVRRAWRPHDAVLGRVDNLKGYHDTERHPEARLIPGLVLYRFDAPLFFANAELFRERVARAGALRGRAAGSSWPPSRDRHRRRPPARRSAALNEELEAAGVALAFAELKDPVRDRLRRYGIEDAIGADRFFPTLGVAVAAYLGDDRRRLAGLGGAARLVVHRRPDETLKTALLGSRRIAKRDPLGTSIGPITVPPPSSLAFATSRRRPRRRSRGSTPDGRPRCIGSMPPLSRPPLVIDQYWPPEPSTSAISQPKSAL